MSRTSSMRIKVIGNLSFCLEVGSPAIFVTDDDGVPIPDGSPASIVNGTDFGTVFVDDLAQQIFTITNPGDETLLLDGLDITGDFTLIGTFPDSVAPGSSIDFTLEMDTSVPGVNLGTITFDTNAPDGTYTFDVQGNVVIRQVDGAIPEPASMVLMAAGMAALSMRRRTAIAS